MMLPINDFNFVVAGIATFAATVGYACTRRLSASLCVSIPPIASLCETKTADVLVVARIQMQSAILFGINRKWR